MNMEYVDEYLDYLFLDKKYSKNTIASYRNALKNCKLPIIHVIGEIDKSETVFTRYEFEYMLNALHEYLIKEDKEN